MSQRLQRAPLVHLHRALTGAFLCAAALGAVSSCRNHATEPKLSPPGAQRLRRAFTPLGDMDRVAFDTTKLVTDAGPDSTTFYRTDIALFFKPTVTDSAITAFLGREHMTFLGYFDTLDQFFVRIPDPGLHLDSLEGALARLRTLPEVRAAEPIIVTPPKSSSDARYPDDGVNTDGIGLNRSGWIQGTGATQALLNIRAPLAWGCETGMYGGTPVRVGVLEGMHQDHPEFEASTPTLWKPSTAPVIGDAQAAIR